jgi:hypothetical protein
MSLMSFTNCEGQSWWGERGDSRDGKKRKEKESRGSNLISSSTNKNTQGDERTNNNNRVEMRMMTVI